MTLSAPALVSVNRALWTVDDRRDSQPDKRVIYTLRNAAQWTHPRGWDGSEGLVIHTSLDLGRENGEIVVLDTERVGHTPRAVWFPDKGLYYWMAVEVTYPSQAAVKRALLDPEGTLNGYRDAFDAQYGVETNPDEQG